MQIQVHYFSLERHTYTQTKFRRNQIGFNQAKISQRLLTLHSNGSENDEFESLNSSMKVCAINYRRSMEHSLKVDQLPIS